MVIVKHTQSMDKTYVAFVLLQSCQIETYEVLDVLILHFTPQVVQKFAYCKIYVFIHTYLFPSQFLGN